MSATPVTGTNLIKPLYRHLTFPESRLSATSIYSLLHQATGISTLKAYLLLHVTLLNRRFKDAGIDPRIGWLLLVSGFILFSFLLFDRTRLAPFIYTAIALGLLVPLTEKRRTDFLRTCFNDPVFRQVRMAENGLVALPFFIFLVFKQQYVIALALLALAAILALFNFRSLPVPAMPTPFSKKPFEFIIGFRNAFYLLGGIYILTALAVSVNNPNLGIFSLLALFAIILGFYLKPENEYYVWIYSLTPTEFLLEKLKTAWLFSAMIVAADLVALLIFFPEKTGLLLLFTLVGFALLTSMILAKYADYPGEIGLLNGIILAFCLAFPPLLLIAIPYFYNRATGSLNRILK